MAFVNEFISPDDIEKYNLEKIDETFVVGGTRARDWTIDRERDIYLRNVAVGSGPDPDERNQTKWTFYWKGTALTLRLDLLDGYGAPGEPGWSHWKLVWLNGNEGLPAHLRPHAEQILQDLREALLTYKDFGVYSTNTEYQITFEVAEGCTV